MTDERSEIDWRSRLEDAQLLRTRASRLSALSTALVAAFTRQQVAQVLVEHVAGALGAIAGIVVLLEETGQYLELIAAHGDWGETLPDYRRFRLDAMGPMSDAVRHGLPVWIETPQVWTERYPGLSAGQANRAQFAVAALPLHTTGKSLGAIGLMFDQPQPFAADDRAFAVSLSDQFALAQARAQLYEAQLQSGVVERLLAEFSNALANSLDYQATLHTVVRLGLPRLGSDCNIYAVDRDGRLRLVVTGQFVAGQPVAVRVPDAAAPSGSDNLTRILMRVQSTGQPVFVDDLSLDAPVEAPPPDLGPHRLSDEPGPQAFMALPLTARRRTFGAWTIYRNAARGPYSTGERALAEELAWRAAVALDSAGLAQQVNSLAGQPATQERERAEALQETLQQQRRAAERLNEAREEELARLWREIHDGLGGSLAGLKMDIVRLRRLISGQSQQHSDDWNAVINSIDEIVQMVRQTASGLRPDLLDDFGLAAAIEWYLDQFQHRFGLTGQLTVDGSPLVLERTRAVTVYRVFEQALTNVAGHAQATNVQVKLEQRHNSLVLEVRDDGLGLTNEQMTQAQFLGLASMRERASILGGQLSIDSAPGQGTVVTLQVPLENTPPSP